MAKKSSGGDSARPTAADGGSGGRKADSGKPPGYFKQLRMIGSFVNQRDRKVIPIAIAIALVVIALCVLGGWLTSSLLYWLIPAIPLGLLSGLLYFNFAARRLQFAMMEGQLGAGWAILDNMRGDWVTEQGVAANRSMDIVHRVTGRPGVVLVGEGNPGRLRGLIAQEKKRVARVAHEIPIYDLQAGNAEGQVPVSKLQRELMKLPRNLSRAEVSGLRSRLKALPPAVQMPKGPLPKGAKMPKMPRPPR
ncbi:DUF4191 domain-containing protein [Allonocardiopsis opalescens]|nr:DUF4191 domain-containing protein [Allonocardiopsis opalescens]